MNLHEPYNELKPRNGVAWRREEGVGEIKKMETRIWTLRVDKRLIFKKPWKRDASGWLMFHSSRVCQGVPSFR